MTVAELGERMSSRELTEWMLYAGMEPFGDEAADARNAINTASIVNGLRGLGGVKTPVKADVFLLGNRAAEEPDLYEKMRAIMPPRPKE